MTAKFSGKACEMPPDDVEYEMTWDRTIQESIADWYDAVKKEEVLTKIDLSSEERCQHLPQLFLNLAKRLHAFKPLGTKE